LAFKPVRQPGLRPGSRSHYGSY